VKGAGNAIRGVAFRVDASTHIGTGHMVRCQALAHSFQKAGVRCTFISARQLPPLRDQLHRDGIGTCELGASETSPERPFDLDQHRDSDGFLSVLDSLPDVDAVIVDHYGIDRTWESKVRATSRKVLAIDDLADRPHDVDFLVDQSLQTPGRIYDHLIDPGCRRMLGPRFALLRDEFAAIRPALSPPEDRQRVLLFAGGADPDNATGLILEAWTQVTRPRPPLDVVIGATHPARTAIEAAVTVLPEVRLHVQTRAMAELLAASRLFVGSAGTVSWERCCLGVPAVMFSIAANQQYNLESLSASRAGISVGRAADLDARALARLIDRLLGKPKLLARMARRSSSLVDGRGADRVALALAAGGMTLRRAGEEDADRAWTWRNSPVTRRYFRDSREVPLADHLAWWSRTLVDPGKRLFIAHCGKHDVGVLRLDLGDGAAEVSIYLDPELTGLGLGPAVLAAGQRAVLAGTAGARALCAEILPGNLASASAFRSAGFVQDGHLWNWQP
jgi:UDP-2,4-diacetamido-2,4,6-trideoxy-beta-L-altropyranose hydrolase